MNRLGEKWSSGFFSSGGADDSGLVVLVDDDDDDDVREDADGVDDGLCPSAVSLAAAGASVAPCASYDTAGPGGSVGGVVETVAVVGTAGGSARLSPSRRARAGYNERSPRSSMLMNACSSSLSAFSLEET